MFSTVLAVFLIDRIGRKGLIYIGVAMSVAGFALWVGTYLIGQFTPWCMRTLDSAGTFFFFAAICLPYLSITRFLVPDTTGKSLEEIEDHWTKGRIIHTTRRLR